jgi:hypothetical protein
MGNTRITAAHLPSANQKRFLGAILARDRAAIEI